jgi:hypothetical protein
VTTKDNLSNTIIGKIDPTGKTTASVSFAGSGGCVIGCLRQKQ